MTDDSLDTRFREKVQEQENTFPSHWPSPDTLWQSLSERRAHQRVKKQNLLWRVAASVLIIAIAGGAFFLHIRPHDSLSHSVAPEILPSKEQDAVEFIARYCAVKNISCNTPVVKELRSDLEQSFRKLDEINQALSVYGSDAELVRAKARIESHQARLIKTIVQTL